MGIHRIKHPGNSAVALRNDERVCAVASWDGKYAMFFLACLRNDLRENPNSLGFDYLARRASSHLAHLIIITRQLMQWHSQTSVKYGRTELIKRTTVRMGGSPKILSGENVGSPAQVRRAASHSGSFLHSKSRQRACYSPMKSPSSVYLHGICKAYMKAT
jgi:hypothetical protein